MIKIIWLKGLIEELSIDVSLPINIHTNSKATMQLAANPVYHEGTKHIEIDCHFIREKLQKGLIKVEYISNKEQPADVLTKGLSRLQHEHLLSKLGVLTIFAPPSLKGSVVI